MPRSKMTFYKSGMTISLTIVSEQNIEMIIALQCVFLTSVILLNVLAPCIAAARWFYSLIEQPSKFETICGRSYQVGDGSVHIRHLRRKITLFGCEF